jgi:hypothetical protein
LNIITSIFGLELSQAIANSPEYQDDAKQWRGYTDCVSMVISHQLEMAPRKIVVFNEHIYSRR